MTGMHWAFSYMNKPWQNGAQGPDAFDCWGLVRHALKHHYGIDAPAVDVDAYHLRDVVELLSEHLSSDRWRKLDRPQDGSCIVMSQSKKPTHVGLWLDINRGGVLHVFEGSNVVFSSPSALRLLGYNMLGAYQHAG